MPFQKTENLLTYIYHWIVGRATVFPVSFLLFVVPDWPPWAVSQILNLLHILWRLFKDLRQQPETGHIRWDLPPEQREARSLSKCAYPSIVRSSNGAGLSHTGQVHVGFFSFICRKKTASKHCRWAQVSTRHGTPSLIFTSCVKKTLIRSNNIVTLVPSFKCT